MSQQINLYEDRLRPRHELATARNLTVCTAFVLVLVAALAWWTNFDAKRKTVVAASVQTQLAEEQKKLTELAKVMAERKVSPALVSERDSLKAVLAQRQEVMTVLDSGQLGNTAGFSAVMTGFARQTLTDLWLTGFSVRMGGEGIEIHGRLFDPAKLPAYVKSLSAEPVFQGRRFAALEMRDVEPDEQPVAVPPVGKVGTDNGAVQAQPLKQPRFVEFILRSENMLATDSSGKGAKP